MSGLIPLRVTAHTPGGFATADPWSPSLDGILAYWALRERIGEEAFALGQTGLSPLDEVDGLPLQRDEGGGEWWWCASSPTAAIDHGTHERWFHRRFDGLDAAGRFLDPAVRRVETAGGPWKAARNRIGVRMVPAVTWHAIGDPDEVRRLLRRCTAIGARLGQGMGAVNRWEVAEDGDERLARYHRPLPVAVALERGLDGPVMDWGLRPPAREHRVPCVMP